MKNIFLAFQEKDKLPLYRVEEPPAFKHSWVIRSDMLNAKKYGDGVYFNLAGQADFKHRFRGEEVPLYVATRRQLDVLGVYGVLGATGVPFSLRKTAKITYQLCANKLQEWWNKPRQVKAGSPALALLEQTDSISAKMVNKPR